MLELQWSELIPLTYEKIQEMGEDLGVYRLSYESADGKRYVFYIGKGKLKIRLFDHISDSEDNTCIKNYIKKYKCFFKYAVIDNEQDRAGAERQLYLYFDAPNCNTYEPEGPDVEINFT